MAMDRVRQAWVLGAPVLAARELIEQSSAASRRQLFTLTARRWDLPLPEGCEERAELERLIGRALPPLRRRRGVFCLATNTFAGQTVGLVRQLAATLGAPMWSSEVDEACAHGLQAAFDWVVGRHGLVTIPRPWRFEELPLTGSAALEGGEGQSAGLAAALSVACQWLHDETSNLRAVAATGCIGWEGRVTEVDNLVEKLDGVQREAPFVERVYVPAGNWDQVPQRHRQLAVPVETVKDAIEDLLGQNEAGTLERLDPATAAEQARKLEVHDDHAAAMSLATAVLDVCTASEDPDTLLARAVARSVEAINLVHHGRVKEAVERFDELREELAAAPEEVRSCVEDANFDALLAAKEASAHIDLLDFTRAVQICRAPQSAPGKLAVVPRLELLGSWARALACSGDLDAAEQMCGEQSDFRLLKRDRHQHPRRLCNLLDVLFRRQAGGEAGMEDRIRLVLVEARAANEHVAGLCSRESNAGYLDLWECRLCAVTGAADRALELAGELPEDASGRFPVHYRHRFAGEALAKAGQLDQALERLDGAVAVISEHAGGFERLVLLTAGASAASLRLAHERDGWQGQAETFLDALHGYREGFAPSPIPTDEGPAWKAALDSALRRLPY